MAGITLSEAVQNLREEVTLAMEAGMDDVIRFESSAVELELQVELMREATAKGGVKWLVFEAGADAKVSSKSVHKLKVTLIPIDRSGNKLKIRDRVIARRRT